MLIFMGKSWIRLLKPANALVIPALVALWPAIAMAQTAAPPPALRRAPPTWLGLLIMVVLLGLVLAVSLMPSKRSHQD